MEAEFCSIQSRMQFEAAVNRAVFWLQQGEPVVLPTETVYGLAANALDPEAVGKIYAIKNRPAENPLIVHVSSLAMAKFCACEWPPAAELLASVFWPGPLTLVLSKAASVPPTVTAGGTTVALRWPRHPFMEAVVHKCGFPLAAPSANLSGQTSPTTAEHVRQPLGKLVRLIVDGGPTAVGIESTVLDVTDNPARILRPGMISRKAIQSVLHASGWGVEPAVPALDIKEHLRSPGLLRRHYAPAATLLLLSWQDESDLLAQLAQQSIPPQQSSILAYERIPTDDAFRHVCVFPRDVEAFARALYAELHRCDARGARYIVVETPPPDPEWEGIRDRLQRASEPRA